MTQNCPLCAPEGEHVIVENDKFRIIRVDDPEFPGYFRLIWQDHLKEVSDLDLEALENDVMTFLALDVGDETHATGIVFIGGVVQTLLLGQIHLRFLKRHSRSRAGRR
mgnify:CR=1 FL=1